MPKVGELLDGRYKLTQELGAGGFGDTFLAVDQTRSQAQVVVKHFAPKERLNSEQFREFTQRFKEEAKALDRLGMSDHIPRLFDFFNQDQDYYLIQEYIEGHDLSREIGGEPCSEDYTRQFLKDVCEILVFIHGEGVIHRDLNPKNIMRHTDGRLVLIDFGSVKEVTARVRKNPLQQPTTLAPATSWFAPPEQIVGKPCFQSDIYAISMTAIVALLGDFPRRIGGKLTTEWDLSPLKVTPEFKAILRKMVRLEYDERYAGAEEVLGALQTLEIPSSPQLLRFQAETVQVDPQGQIVKRQVITPEYFTEWVNGIGIDMVVIPGGQFWMGSPKGETAQYDSEYPQHEVSISDFFMGKFVVTQAQWRAVTHLPQISQKLSADPSKFRGDNRPVECVSWDEAQEFCARLSQATGKVYRLPSEAEWEYACRAGTTTPFAFGATLNTDMANYDGNSTYGKGRKGVWRQETVDVGSFPPNAWGLYEMHGNVWEWCEDGYHENYNGAPTDGKAWINTSSKSKMRRGGSWHNVAKNCRSANRYSDMESFWGNYLSFRLVLPKI